MKLVVGLGNPGLKYSFTRHNTGFLVLDYYFIRNKTSFGDKTQFGALAYREGDVWFIKPQDFYNDSGKAVLEFAKYYKIKHSDILVICDNFDLEFGKVRFRSSGLAGGNNGLKSIDGYLGASDYPRIRIGTGNEELRAKLGDVEFVLSKFTPEEKEKLPNILNEACDKIDEFIRDN